MPNGKTNGGGNDHDLLIRMDERIHTIFKKQAEHGVTQEQLKEDVSAIKKKMFNGEGKIQALRKDLTGHCDEHEKVKQEAKEQDRAFWSKLSVIVAIIVVVANSIIWLGKFFWNIIRGGG